MKCRKINKVLNGQDVVRYDLAWFGSFGKNTNDKKIPAENYSEGTQGVIDSLTQRLSLIKGELWTNPSFGIPLFDKNRHKAIIDSNIIDTISTHPGVKNIITFTSYTKNNNYYFECKILTIYGDETIIRS